MLMPTRRRWKDRLIKWFTNFTPHAGEDYNCGRGGSEISVMITAEYKTFFKEIKERIHKAQYDALKSVNRELINLYWDIGKSIVAKQGHEDKQ